MSDPRDPIKNRSESRKFTAGDEDSSDANLPSKTLAEFFQKAEANFDILSRNPHKYKSEHDSIRKRMKASKKFFGEMIEIQNKTLEKQIKYVTSKLEKAKKTTANTEEIDTLLRKLNTDQNKESILLQSLQLLHDKIKRPAEISPNKVKLISETKTFLSTARKHPELYSPQQLENFLIKNQAYLRSHPKKLKQLRSIYQNNLHTVANELMGISRNLFINLTDLGNTKETPASHMSLMQTADNLSLQIVDEILSSPTVQERTFAMERWIRIAYICEQAGDWHTATAIKAGINHSTLSRLKMTSAGLTEKSLELLTKWKSDMMEGGIRPDTQVRAMREENKKHAIIPFFGAYRTALTFANDQAKTQLSASNKILPQATQDLVSEIEKMQKVQQKHLSPSMASNHFYTLEKLMKPVDKSPAAEDHRFAQSSRLESRETIAKFEKGDLPTDKSFQVILNKTFKNFENLSAKKKLFAEYVKIKAADFTNLPVKTIEQMLSNRLIRNDLQTKPKRAAKIFKIYNKKLNEIAASITATSREVFLNMSAADFANVDSKISRQPDALLKYTAAFDLLSLKVREDIVNPLLSNKERTLAFERWVNVMDKCFNNGDHFGFTAISSAFNGPEISRLKHLEKGLSVNAQKILSGSMSRLPMEGAYVTQLTKDQANNNVIIPNHVGSRSVITRLAENTDPRARYNDTRLIVQMLQSFQADQIHAKPSSTVTPFISMNEIEATQMARANDEKYADNQLKKVYEVSLQIGPRNALPKPTKILKTRLLSDLVNYDADISNDYKINTQDIRASLPERLNELVTASKAVHLGPYNALETQLNRDSILNTSGQISDDGQTKLFAAAMQSENSHNKYERLVNNLQNEIDFQLLQIKKIEVDIKRLEKELPADEIAKIKVQITEAKGYLSANQEVIASGITNNSEKLIDFVNETLNQVQKAKKEVEDGLNSGLSDLAKENINVRDALHSQNIEPLPASDRKIRPKLQEYLKENNIASENISLGKPQDTELIERSTIDIAELAETYVLPEIPPVPEDPSNIAPSVELPDELEELDDDLPQLSTALPENINNAEMEKPQVSAPKDRPKLSERFTIPAKGMEAQSTTRSSQENLATVSPENQKERSQEATRQTDTTVLPPLPKSKLNVNQPNDTSHKVKASKNNTTEKLFAKFIKMGSSLKKLADRIEKIGSKIGSDRVGHATDFSIKVNNPPEKKNIETDPGATPETRHRKIK